MNLTLTERVQLVEKASAERARKRLIDADATLNDGIRWATCDCDMCRDRRTWMRGQHKRLTVHEDLIFCGVFAIVGMVLALLAGFWR